MREYQRYLPRKQFEERTGISDVYRFVKAGVLTPHYLPGSFTTAYFDVLEFESKLKPQPDGKTKRKSYNKKDTTHEPV